ncbi:MAG: B12-binding domain-containing radical SAM protein [Candidatus Kariarchaeaceae archaeon]|jgi:radical SAM superfamily enzyme YgiQ (UPF0313 family)
MNKSKETSVCFIHTPCNTIENDRLEPPLGLLLLATIVKNNGYPVKLLDLSSHRFSEIERNLPQKYHVYAFSTYSANYWLTLRIVEMIRESNPDAILIAGGPHATALPENVIREGFDVVVTGEGELAIISILDKIERGRRPDRIVAGIGPDPLDTLSFPDYRLINLDSYDRLLGGRRCISILSSRGCPYQCVFCNSIVMGAGTSMRFRSPANVVREILTIKRDYGISSFRFQDDLFTIDLSRVAALTKLFIPEDITYRCFSRVNNFSYDMAQALRAGGCMHVSFGVESGSRKLLSKTAMNKGHSIRQIVKALKNAGDAGLRVRIFLIVGFPGETDDTIEETLRLVKSCRWSEFSVYPLLAYPGTPLHDHPKKFGITYIDRDYSKYLQVGRHREAGYTIRTKSFDERKVQQWRDHVIQELSADGRIWSGDAKQFC